MHFITLKLTGHNLPFTDIEIAINKKPTFLYHEGETKETKYGNVTYKEDGIAFQEVINSDKEIETKLNEYAQICYGCREKLIDWSQKFRSFLWVSVYPENAQIHFSISPQTMKCFSRCGIELTTSIMSLQEFYNGEYGSKLPKTDLPND